jgi:hypothetical protein
MGGKELSGRTMIAHLPAFSVCSPVTHNRTALLGPLTDTTTYCQADMPTYPHSYVPAYSYVYTKPYPYPHADVRLLRH